GSGGGRKADPGSHFPGETGGGHPRSGQNLFSGDAPAPGGGPGDSAPSRPAHPGRAHQRAGSRGHSRTAGLSAPSGREGTDGGGRVQPFAFGDAADVRPGGHPPGWKTDRSPADERNSPAGFRGTPNPLRGGSDGSGPVGTASTGLKPRVERMPRRF